LHMNHDARCEKQRASSHAIAPCCTYAPRARRHTRRAPQKGDYQSCANEERSMPMSTFLHAPPSVHIAYVCTCTQVHQYACLFAFWLLHTDTCYTLPFFPISFSFFLWLAFPSFPHPSHLSRKINKGIGATTGSGVVPLYISALVALSREGAGERAPGSSCMRGHD
jgi:hypothetical protein